jgi:hypothetical protein
MAKVPTTKGNTIVTPVVAKSEVAVVAVAAPAVQVVTKTVMNGIVTVVSKPAVTVVNDIIYGGDSSPNAQKLVKELEDWYPDVNFIHTNGTYVMKF